MRCYSCGQEVGEETERCSHCGQPMETGIGKPAGVQGESVSRPGMTAGAEADISSEVPPSEAKAESRPRRPEPRAWHPDRENVESWAREELNHYEVLGLGEDAPDGEVENRVNMLERTLEEWARDPMDARLQDLGREGLRRLSEMRQAFQNRAAYNQELEWERHQRAVEEIRRLAEDFTRDNILQADELQTLQRRAVEEGLSPEELNEILGELDGRGVLTGITVDGGRVRTLEELMDKCQGRGGALVDVMWGGEIDGWLEQVIGRRDLADQLRKIRQQYAENRPLGAQTWLWYAGEKALILTGHMGEERVSTIGEWVRGIYGRGLEEASQEALIDGRLERWLRIAMGREDLAKIATEEKRNGREGLWRLLWEIGGREVSVESAYEATQRLVQEMPDFLDARYYHAIHCCRTGRLEEMRRHLKYVIESDPTYSERASLDPAFAEVRDDVRKLIQSVTLQMWLREAVEPAQKRDVITDSERLELINEAERRGINRATARRVINQLLPSLQVEPSQLDFGTIRRGKTAHRVIEVKNTGGGHLRGRVIAGAYWIETDPTKLDPTKSEQFVEVRIDTSGLPPGVQTADVSFRTSGGVYSVPVKVEIKKSRILAFLAVIAAALSVAVLALPKVKIWGIHHPPKVEEVVAQPRVITPGEKVTLKVRAIDQDGDDLTYTWDASAGRIMGNGPTVTLDTSTIDGRVTTPILVRVTVDDGYKAVRGEINIPIGVPPFKVSLESPGEARPGDTVSLSAHVQGGDNQALTYQWSTSRGHIVGSGPQVRLRIPQAASPGSIRVRVTVTDGRGYSATDEKAIEIIVRTPANHPPVIHSVDIDHRQVRRGQRVSVRVWAEDDDGDALTYECTATNGAQVIGGGPSFRILTTGVHTAPGPVRVEVMVRAYDGHAWSIPETRSITVVPPPPPIRSFPVLHIHDPSDRSAYCRGSLEIDSDGRVRYRTDASGDGQRDDFSWSTVSQCGRGGTRIRGLSSFYINLRGGQGFTFAHVDEYGNDLGPQDVLLALGCP